MLFHMQCVDDLLAAAHGRSTVCKYDNEVVDYVYDAYQGIGVYMCKLQRFS